MHPSNRAFRPPFVEVTFDEFTFDEKTWQNTFKCLQKRVIFVIMKLVVVFAFPYKVCASVCNTIYLPLRCLKIYFCFVLRKIRENASKILFSCQWITPNLTYLVNVVLLIPLLVFCSILLHRFVTFLTQRGFIDPKSSI